MMKSQQLNRQRMRICNDWVRGWQIEKKTQREKEQFDKGPNKFKTLQKITKWEQRKVNVNKKKGEIEQKQRQKRQGNQLVDFFPLNFQDSGF